MDATSTRFVVRPYAEQDREGLLRLLAAVWPRKQDIERHVRERWWWRWDPPPVLLIEESGHPDPVGLCAYIPFQLRSRGREQSGAWFVDFFILPGYQGLGLGQRLAQHVQDRFDLTASLSQTAMAYRVFQKLGWSERKRVTLLVHPLPWRAWFRARPHNVQVEGYPVDGSLPVLAGLDALWARVRDQYACLAVRDSAHLLHRYAARGERQYTLLSAHRDGSCVGYMVLRAVRPLSGDGPPAYGLIVDYLVAPGDTAAFAALLSEAGTRLAAEQVRRLAILTTSPPDARVLRRRGFLSPDTPMLGRALLGNVKWLTYYSKTDASFVDPGGWFLTMGDCDIDDVWY